jgi:hypothetical protein
MNNVNHSLTIISNQQMASSSTIIIIIPFFIPHNDHEIGYHCPFLFEIGYDEREIYREGD